RTGRGPAAAPGAPTRRSPGGPGPSRVTRPARVSAGRGARRGSGGRHDTAPRSGPARGPMPARRGPTAPRATRPGTRRPGRPDLGLGRPARGLPQAGDRPSAAAPLAVAHQVADGPLEVVAEPALLRVGLLEVAAEEPQCELLGQVVGGVGVAGGGPEVAVGRM